MSKRKDNIPRFRAKLEDEVTETVTAAGSPDIRNFQKPLPAQHQNEYTRFILDKVKEVLIMKGLITQVGQHEVAQSAAVEIKALFDDHEYERHEVDRMINHFRMEVNAIESGKVTKESK